MTSFWDNYKKGLGVIGNTIKNVTNNKVAQNVAKGAFAAINPIGYANNTLRNTLYNTLKTVASKTIPTVEAPGKNSSIGKKTTKQEPKYQPVANQYANNSQSVSGGYTGGSGGSGGGGYSSVVSSSEGGIMPQRIDLTDILAAYEQGASAQRKTITDSSSSQRQSLLDSLKRFQQETAEARSQQQRSYNAGRADLEGQAFMANRQAAQSAAARGLGGSGLQQLAQIQNLVNQSNATNTLAQSNVDVLKAIATAAQNKEEDTNKAIADLEKEAANKIAQIDANNAEAKANLQYKEDVRYEEARRAAEQFAAQLEASNRAAAAGYSNYASQRDQSIADAYDMATNDLNTALERGMRAIKQARNSSLKGKEKSAAIQKAFNDAQDQIYIAKSGLNIDLSPYLTQLDNSYNTYYDSKNKYK